MKQSVSSGDGLTAAWHFSVGVNAIGLEVMGIVN